MQKLQFPLALTIFYRQKTAILKNSSFNFTDRAGLGVYTFKACYEINIQGKSKKKFPRENNHVLAKTFSRGNRQII